MTEQQRLPRISVVTPSYNQAAFLPATVSSVLGQGYPDLEYIVQDGASTDGTRSLLESLPDWIKWASEKDDGQADAVNKGWGRASGEVLGWLNSDDLYEPGALRRVGEVFAVDPTVEWVVGRCRIIDAFGREVRRTVTRYKNLLLDRLSLPLLLMENPISQMAVFVRRRAIDAVGLLRTDLRYTMDYDLWLRLMRLSRPRMLKQVLASFRVHESSKSAGGFRGQFAEEHSVAAEHARAAGLSYLLPVRRLTTGKTVTMYAVVEAIARIRGRMSDTALHGR
ncbi:MAG TPA: glycosyltransferase family 2 protein [Actinomycetota bacterium]|nr:glycosyltransferase family 2 protein [Actinomycetota bacterium]